MNSMKKIIAATLASTALLLAPLAAFAASVDLSPLQVAVKTGKTFTVNISANPAGASVYTVRANLSFDPALVEETDFSFASGWIPLSQPAYDVVNNTTGSVIKTAGHPGALTTTVTFGTVTFRAKATGTATIAVTTDTLLLDKTNQNLKSGAQGVTTVSITAPAPVSSVPVNSPATNAASRNTPTPVVVVTEASSTATSSLSIVVPDNSQVAAVATSPLMNALTFGTGKVVVPVAIVILIIIALVWFFQSRRNR